MPCSSLVLSKFHGLNQSSTNSNAKLDAESVPILSLDVAHFPDGTCKILTSGADNAIRIWRFNKENCGLSNVKSLAHLIQTSKNPERSEEFKKSITENKSFSVNWFTFLSELIRHEKSVNSAKYSPNKKLIASASDDNNVIIWKQTEAKNNPVGVFGFGSARKTDEESLKFYEHWQANRVCSGHSQDAICISWCGDQYLYTGGIDHKVQGFSIIEDDNGLLRTQKVFSYENPSSKYIQGLVTSLDKHLTVAFGSDGHLIYFNKKEKLKTTHSYRMNFCQETMHPSMFRKADFSPDGLILAAPSGVLRKPKTGQFKNFCCHFYLRTKIFDFEEPVVSLPTRGPVVGCAWNKFVKFEFGYLLCVFTLTDVLIYKFNQFETAGSLSAASPPIVQLAFKFENLHYEQLTDCAWADRSTLLVCSRDGFINVLKFDLLNDFGRIVTKAGAEAVAQKADNDDMTNDDDLQILNDNTDQLLKLNLLAKPTVKELTFTEHNSSKVVIKSNKPTAAFLEDCSKNWEHNIEFNLDDLDDSSEDSDSPENSPSKNQNQNSSETAANKNVRRSTRKNFGKVSEATLRQRERDRQRAQQEKGNTWLNTTISEGSSDDEDFKNSASGGSSCSTSGSSDSESESESSSDESGESGTEKESGSASESSPEQGRNLKLKEAENATTEESTPNKKVRKRIILNPPGPSSNSFGLKNNKTDDRDGMMTNDKKVSENVKNFPFQPTPQLENFEFKSTSKRSISVNENKENIESIDLTEEDSGDEDFEEKEEVKPLFNSPRIDSLVKRKINDFGGAKAPPVPQTKPKARKVLLTTLK